jgi:peptidoglycan hydrolase CwlO-like protein
MMKKCLIKKRAYIEEDDLHRWVQNKELIQEALDEAYLYIAKKVELVKTEIEEIKNTAEDYEKRLNELDDESFKAHKKLGDEEVTEP